MGYSFETVEIGHLASLREREASRLKWPLFVLPSWLSAWWSVFGGGYQSLLGVVKKDAAIIGVAPLKVEGDVASFMGSPDLADYQDFVINGGAEKEFFSLLLDELKKAGIRRLETGALRPESVTLKHLGPLAEGSGLKVSCRPADVSFDMELPRSFDDYLEMLEAKQRRELRRQLRRLAKAGEVSYRAVNRPQEVKAEIGVFIEMMRASRQDKAHFMDEQMEGFFERLAAWMSARGLIRLGLLELDGSAVAAVLCFDYNDTMYLYNSGYDPEYAGLGVGLMSKVLCIKDAIELGRRRFDFLKGDEVYKSRLGGRKVPLERCSIDFQGFYENRLPERP